MNFLTQEQLEQCSTDELKKIREEVNLKLDSLKEVESEEYNALEDYNLSINRILSWRWSFELFD